MAKDAKGHGSEKRGESSGDPNGRNNPLFDPVKAAMASARGTMRGYTDASPMNMLSDKGAAATLANDHPKSDAVPVHSGASGRGDSFFGRLNDRQAAAQNKEANDFQRSRRSSGPHYLDPKDPRGRR